MDTTKTKKNTLNIKVNELLI